MLPLAATTPLLRRYALSMPLIADLMMPRPALMLPRLMLLIAIDAARDFAIVDAAARC